MIKKTLLLFTCFTALISCKQHSESHNFEVDGIYYKIALLMRRDSGGDDVKVIKPHLLHKCSRSLDMSDVRRREGSAVDAYAADILVIRGTHSSTILGFFFDGR